MLSTSYRCVLIYPLIKGERERVKSGGSILQNEKLGLHFQSPLRSKNAVRAVCQGLGSFLPFR